MSSFATGGASFCLLLIIRPAQRSSLNRVAVGLTLPAAPAQAHEAVPEGCEGAFSPYVEPSKAHILGRCLSSISESGKAFS